MQQQTIISLWRNLLISVTLLALSVGLRSDCGISVNDKLHDLSFLKANELLLPSQANYAPLVLTIQPLVDYYEAQARIQANDNITEWQQKLCRYADSAEVHYVIYDASIGELQDLYEAAISKAESPEITLQNNAFAQTIAQNHCHETAKYLLYARRCEPYVTRPPVWKNASNLKNNRQLDAQGTHDVAMMYKLISEGREEFRTCTSPFLRIRYTYQMLRLAHYAKDYDAVLQLYDILAPKIDTRARSIVAYWVFGHRAAALLHTGKRAEAAYWYSLVFRNSPAKRESALRSFDIRTAEEWRDCLKFCRTDEERATLFVMRASGANSKALEDMQSLYALEPSNDALELLLLRETLKMERVMLGKDFRRPRYDAATRAKTAAYLLSMRDFVHQVAEQRKVKRPALWLMAEGYLTSLAGDYTVATSQLRRAYADPTADDVLKEQIDAFFLANKISTYQATDSTTEKDWQVIRTSAAYLSNADFEYFFNEKAASLYRQEGKKGVAFLCDYGLNDLIYNPQMELIDDLIALCQKSDKTLFEKELVVRGSGKTIESELYDLKGSLLLSEYKLEAALEAFQKMLPIERAKFKFNPFTERYKDCVHNCLNIDTTALNKAELVQRLLDLEFKAKAALGDGAPHYYQLGLAFYNMSYFGDAYRVTDFFRSGASWQRLQTGKNTFPYHGKAFGQRENTDCSVALNYFEKARQLCGNDPELGAKCAYMAARCEQNQYFTNPQSRYIAGNKRIMPNVPPPYRRYFELLRTSYNRTEFYKTAIKECKYLGFYVSRR